MSENKPRPEEYHEVRERGEITRRDGWHKPERHKDRRMPVGGLRRRRTQPDHPSGCDCDLVTDKGAYRDETVELPDGTVVHYYHQSPVVVEYGDTVRVSSCGYKTSTTKERINRYLPGGYRVYQRDFEWFLSTPGDGDDRDFKDGMTIEK